MVAPLLTPAKSGDTDTLLQSIRRAFQTLPLDERRRAIRLLQGDLNEADSAAVLGDSDRLPADHPAWDALDHFIREGREAERACVDPGK